MNTEPEQNSKEEFFEMLKWWCKANRNIIQKIWFGKASKIQQTWPLYVKVNPHAEEDLRYLVPHSNILISLWLVIYFFILSFINIKTKKHIIQVREDWVRKIPGERIVIKSMYGSYIIQK